MKYLSVFMLTLMLASPPAHADEKVDAAIRALDAITADAAKAQAYCAIVKEMFAAGEDEEKAEEVGLKMEQYLTSLGPDYLSAWQLAETLASESPEGKALDEAFDRLEEKCGD